MLSRKKSGGEPNKRAGGDGGMAPMWRAGRRWPAAPHYERCDMKLHSVLLGGAGCPTEPCVSPQVFHGSMRLAGCGLVAITGRGAPTR